MRTVAVLVAAGRGERMGAAVPKAFLTLAGETLLMRSARAFQDAASVDALVVVAPEDRVAEAHALVSSLAKMVCVVAGGRRRQDSVQRGLAAAPRDAEVVLVHDAARPLVSAEVIDAVVSAAREHGAAVPVVPLVDTIKRVREGVLGETVDRSQLAAAQTPQGFRRELLVRAFAAAEADGAEVTDEAMAAERIGIAVRAVPGSPDNRKITTADDLAWAEDVLRRRAGAR